MVFSPELGPLQHFDHARSDASYNPREREAGKRIRKSKSREKIKDPPVIQILKFSVV